MHTDPIADMLNRITTAYAAKKEQAQVPFSNMNYGIAKVLERRGYVKAVKLRKTRVGSAIEVELRYKPSGPAFSAFRRVSKPGQRVYVPVSGVKRVKGGYGLGILSTSKGLMTDREAKERRVGGELLCQVW